MKPILLLTLIPCLATGSARAALVIYNFTGSQTVVGNGIETTAHLHGALFWDIDTGNAFQVGAFTVAGSKRFVVVDQSGSRLWQTAGANGHTFTAILSSTNASDKLSASFTYGKNSNLSIGTGYTIALPRTAKATGFAVLSPDSSASFGPAALIYSFSQSQTKVANESGTTLSNAVTNFRTKLIAQGYIDATP